MKVYPAIQDASINYSNIAQYNPFDIPPNWKLAQNHGYACRPGKFNNQNKLTCPCCLNYVSKKQISLWEDNKQLSFLGEGFPLYFNFLKFCIMMLIVLIIDCGAASMLLNNQFNSCNDNHLISKESQQGCRTDFYFKYAFIKRDLEFDTIKMIIRIFSFIAQLIILIYFREQQFSLAHYLDEINTTLSDYTLVIDNIPLGLKDYKAKLKGFINKLNSSLEVKEILIIQDLREYYILQQKFQDIIQRKKKQIKNQQNQQRIKNLQILYDEELSVSKEIQFLAKKMQQNQDLYFIGRAYVTMNSQSQKEQIIKLINFAQIDIIESFFSNYNSSQIKMIAEQAKQPLQINWKNIHLTNNQRNITVLSIWTIYILICIIIAIIFVFIIKEKTKKIQLAIQNSKADPLKSEDQIREAKILGYFIIILINIINKYGISYIAYQITQYQRHIHYTNFQYSFALKYMLSLFFTTALMILCAENFSNYTTPFGIIEEQTFMFIFNGFFFPLIWIFANPRYIVYFIRKQIHYQATNLTQKQANLIMELPSYDMGKRYAQVISIMWFTFLYIQLIPIGIIFSVSGLILYYIIDKYVLLRRSTVKQGISSQLSKSMIKLLELALIFKPAGQLIFASTMRNELQIDSIVMLCFGFIYLFIPIQKILAILFQEKFKCQQKKYDQVKDNFIEKYSNCYPIRKQKIYLRDIPDKNLLLRAQVKKNEKKVKKIVKQFKQINKIPQSKSKQYIKLAQNPNQLKAIQQVDKNSMQLNSDRGLIH